MLLKLAGRNIRRSVRDYAIYFVTLVFGVAVFYAFNSVGDQKILFDLEQASASKASLFSSIQYMMAMFSVVVSCTLGFLIVYANRFLIRRRKHEFGIYLTLGMSPGEISRIVLYETIIVGLVSFIVGLVAGVMISQGLSFFTAGMFEITMDQYQFIFSEHAFNLTLMCFVAIYVVVALFNLISVSRYKLINLLSAHAKNEKSPVRSPWACLVAFIVAVAMLAFAYQQLLVSEGVLFAGSDPHFTRATVFMLLGTLVLFWSLAGFVIAVLQLTRSVYFRGLTMFTMRQIASKVNTAFMSLWAICVILFFAITTFSTGMGLVDVFNSNVERTSPYDASFRADVWYMNWEELAYGSASADSNSARKELLAQEQPEYLAELEAHNFSALARMQDDMPHWDELVKDAAEIDVYNASGTTYRAVFEDAGIDYSSLESDPNYASILNASAGFIGLSQFNDNLALLGEKPLELTENQYAVCNTFSFSGDMSKKLAESDSTLSVMGRELTSLDDVIGVNLENNITDSSGLVLVVPDSMIEALRDDGAFPVSETVNVMYRTPGAETDKAILADLAIMQPAEIESEINGETIDWAMHMWPVSMFNSQTEMRDQAGSMRVMVTYLALYIGFVLLATTAAILAIQQLSEASDSASRYRLLNRLGCDVRTLDRSLLVQVLVYFLAPLAIAACHSACAITSISRSILDVLGASPQTAILTAAAFVVVIYGSYLLVTYFASRGIMRQSLKG